MEAAKETKKNSALWKTASVLGLSTFYFAMLAYPFGVTKDGYVVERALIAGVIFFAISIPAWVINLKREFCTEEVAPSSATASSATVKKPEAIPKIGQLAQRNQWLSPQEIKQVLFCQDQDGRKFGEVAVKRNFLTMSQVKSLLDMQQVKRHEAKVH